MSEHEPKIEKFIEKGVTPELLPNQMPVMVHRWFSKEGEGWAYNPSIDYVRVLSDQNVGRLIMDAQRERGGFKVRLRGGEWFICTVKDDTTSKFELARERNPFYLTAAIVSGPEPVDTQLEHIYEQLLDLPEVDSPGQNDNLIITDKEE